MKMRHCFAVIVLALGSVQPAFAQQHSESGQPQVLNIKLGDDQSTLPLAVDTVPSPGASEEISYVTKMRQALYLLSLEESKNTGTTFKGIAKSSAQKFTKESVTFFIAIFAVKLQSLVIDYSDNPSALSKHLESIKDPIGQLSFYLFMVSQGVYMNHFGKGLGAMDPGTKARQMKKLGYRSMAAASIVSGLGAEVVTTLKECGKQLFNTVEDKTNEEKMKEQSVACDNAYKSWVPNKKVQQLIPQVLGLLAASKGAEWLESGGKAAFQLAAWGPKNIAKYIVEHPGTVFKFTSLQLVIAATPGALEIKSVAFIGKFVKFSIFTAVSEFITPYFQKFFGNAFKPIEFSQDAPAFDDALARSKDSNWKNTQALETVAKELGNISELMQDWRQKQLTKFYTSHAVWGENTMRVLDQTAATYAFDKFYTDSLFSTLKTGHGIHTGRLKPAAMNTETNYPFRQLPLYGVKLSEKLENDKVTLEDLYLLDPAVAEENQLKTIRKVNQELMAQLETNELKGDDQKLLLDIVTAFNGNSIPEMGIAIAKMNQVANLQTGDPVLWKKDSVMVSKYGYSPYMKAFMAGILNKLGNPHPILMPGMGFSYAYEVNSMTKLALEKLDRPKGAGAETRLTADYLWIQLACGGDSLFYADPWGLTPGFLPPKLMKANVRVPDLCQAVSLPHVDRNGQAMSSIHSKSFTTEDGRTFKGISDLVFQNMNYDILGDYRDANATSNFDKWWDDNVKTGTVMLFKTFDAKYVEVLANLAENWHSAAGPLDRINQSQYLDRDALANLSFELNIYATVLNELLDGRAASNLYSPKIEPSVPRYNQAKPFEPVVPRYNLANPHPLPYPTGPQPRADSLGFLARLKSVVDAEKLAAIKADEAARWKAAVSPTLANSKENAALAAKIAEETRVKAATARANLSIYKGERMAMMKEISNLLTATQARIDILRKFTVTKNPATGLYYISNFPAKADSKAAAEDTTAALKELAALIKTAEGRLSPAQIEIVGKSMQGLESVVSEVGAMTMAMYTTKYRFEDSYEDLLAERKATQEKLKAPAIKGALGPGGK